MIMRVDRAVSVIQRHADVILIFVIKVVFIIFFFIMQTIIFSIMYGQKVNQSIGNTIIIVLLNFKLRNC